MRRDDTPCCDVCKKKAKGKRLFLPIGNRLDAVLCEQCFRKVPSGLQRKVLNNADNQTGQEWNQVMVAALQSSSGRTDFNHGHVLLLVGRGVHKMEKYGTASAMEDVRREYERLFFKCLYTFKNGHIVYEAFPS